MKRLSFARPEGKGHFLLARAFCRRKPPGINMHGLDKILSSRLAPLIPPIILAFCLRLWAVDTLNWDEWLIWTDTLAKLQAGSLSLADIMLQNNEQRSAIVRLTGLAFFPWLRLARWPELCATFAMAGGCVLLAWRLLLRSGWNGQDRRPLALFSMLGFSLLQWETFTVGINTSVILPALTIWAGACLGAGEGLLGTGRLFLMALVGLPASFSFANGLFYWPCLAPLIALRTAEGGNRRRAALATGTWLCFGALVWLTYFHGYVKPAHHPSILLAFETPHMLAGYFLTYLGGALAGDRTLQPLALLTGCFVLIALGALMLCLWRTRQKDGGERLRSIAPWLCVAAFSLLTAAATAAARGGFGLGQAQESRYATFSSPLWMVLCAVWFLHGEHLGVGARRWLGRGFALCAALFAVSSLLAALVLHNRAPRLERARQQLYSFTRPEELREIFPDPAFLMAQAPLFVEMRAGAWRFLPAPEAIIQGEPTPGEAGIEPKAEIDGRVPGFLLRGTAPGHAGAWLTVRALHPLDARAIALGKVEADGSFALFLPESALPEGNTAVFPAVLLADGRTLCAVGPSEGLVVDNPGRSVERFDLDRNFFVPGLTQRGDPQRGATGL
jgi:hypothetical protein